MNRRNKLLIGGAVGVLVIAGVVVAVASGGGGKKRAAPTTATATTLGPTTTQPPPVAPLTGLPDPNRVANRSFLLSSWLIENRSTIDAGALPEWQRIVDALVVAGVSRLAPYSE